MAIDSFANGEEQVHSFANPVDCRRPDSKVLPNGVRYDGSGVNENAPCTSISGRTGEDRHSQEASRRSESRGDITPGEKEGGR